MIKLLFNGVDKRVYIFIVLITVFFSILSFYVHKNIKKQIETLHNSNREIIIDEIKTKSLNKLKELQNILESSAAFIGKSSLLSNEEELLVFLDEIKSMDDAIDMAQFLGENSFLYGDLARYSFSKDFVEKGFENRHHRGPKPLEKPWYVKTKHAMKTTVTVIDDHGVLNQQTINICTPVHSNDDFMGVMCLIVESRSIIKRLHLLSLPKNTSFYIVMQDGTCLSMLDENNFFNSISEYATLQDDENILNINIDKKSVSIANLGIFSWVIAVVTDNQEYRDNMSSLTKNSLFMIAGFLTLIILANIAHESIRFSLNKKYNQIKKMTNLWLKDSSRGLVLFDSLKRINFANQKAKRLLKLIYATHGNMYIDKLLKYDSLKDRLHVKDRFYEVVVNPLNDGSLFEGWVVRITDITKERELERQKDEYEQLLAHQGKMVEMGELIGGINHQLKQPITSANLCVANVLQQHKNQILTDNSLITNLTYCQKSLDVMNETIDLYKNYYKSEHKSEQFIIKDSFQKVARILEEKICLHNIKVKIECDVSLSIVSKENIVQQILLVLLNNAIDSAKDSVNKSVILSFDENQKIIRVSDFGKGLSEDIAKNLFKQIVDTKKDKGTGLGLYFANKLAKNKINGFIKVSNYQNPTVFELKFLD